jgi:hypothetical protein
MEQKKQGDAQFKQYEINDPRYDATYVEKTEEAIKARAEKIGANGYDAVTQDNERVQFVKQESEWRKQSDVLAELQEKRRIAEEASRQQNAEAIKRAQENMTQEERDEVQAAREQMGEAPRSAGDESRRQFSDYTQQVDETAQDILRRTEAGERITDEQRQAAVKLAEDAIATKRVEISGSDPAAREASKMPEPQQMAAKGIAAALARADAEPNNPFKDESLSKTYDSERSYMKYLAERAEREAQAQPSGPAPLQFTHNGQPATLDLDRFRQTEQGATAEQIEAADATAEREAQAQPSGPAPLQFTHNGQPATLDLDRFRQTEQDAAEVDPFGPALDEEKAAPQAAEEEADPFGPALDDDKPAAASQPAEGEEEQLNTIEPVIQREAEKGASEAEQLVIDEQTRERLAQQRARDRAEAQAALGHQPQEAEPPKQAKEAEAPGVVDKPFKENNVESDEILTAPKEPVRPVLPPEVEREYVNVGSKYYSQKNPEVEAFEDKGNKLQTRSNSEQVASNLVKIAEARGWDEIKVSGTETFRREVWMEAAARGMEVKGYTPSEQDKAALASKVKGMAANSVENGKTAEAVKEKSDFRGRENEKGADKAKSIEQQRAESFKKDSREEALKKFPELSGAYAAQAAMNKKMDADGLTQAQKQYAQQKINEKIAKSIETGKIPEVQRRQEVTAKRDKQHHEERELSR